MLIQQENSSTMYTNQGESSLIIHPLPFSSSTLSKFILWNENFGGEKKAL